MTHEPGHDERLESLLEYLKATRGFDFTGYKRASLHRRISRLRYSHACPEASAVAACVRAGIDLSPGMEVSYVVTDARTWAVELDWEARRADTGYYRRLLDNAWEEAAFALGGHVSPMKNATLPALQDR